MKPMFSYFGSKYKLAKHYGAPRFDTVIEPFAGSAAYSLYWEPKNVILYDANPEIAITKADRGRQYEINIDNKNFSHLDIPS